MSTYTIIGSGISGCTAAFELAQQGHQVNLFESSNTIGGAILGYSCKATDECSRCGVCVAHTQLHETVTHPDITTSLGMSLQSVHNNDGPIELAIIRKNPTISYHACTSCDKCVSACPEQCITKIQRGELVQYAIDYEKCLLHKGQQCNLCSEACASGAIFAKAATTEVKFPSDAALIATGHTPYDATQKPRLGYSRLKNVMTGVEAEDILGKQMYLGAPDESIAFVQCVGSRDPHIGRNYCSTVCCAYALRLARIMKHRSAETQATIYYIDIQNFDKTFTLFRKSVEESGVRFSRGVPFSIDQSSNGKLQLHIENMDGEESIVEHDRVVLSVGMGSAAGTEKIASLFGVERDEFGFLTSSPSNVFVSGTCREPLSIPDSMSAARSMALEILQATNGTQVENLIHGTQETERGASKTSSFDTTKVPLHQDVLVLGAGIAGISTAQELQGLGYSTRVIEQAQESGGQLQKAQQDFFPSIWPFAPKVISGIEVFTESSLLDLSGNIGNFSARIQTPDGEKRFQCGAVVVASGTPIPPEVDTSSHIISMTELELAFADLVKRQGVRSIGIVLDRNIDEDKLSTQIALTLVKKIQAMQRYQAYLFCRDIRVAAKELELLYDEAREAGGNIVKYDGQLSLNVTDRGVLVTYTDAILREEMTLYCDRIAMSPFGLSRIPDNDLAELTALSTDAYGQIQDNNIHLFPEQTNRPGIFVVGACRGQSFMPRIMTEAQVTALEVHKLLSQHTLEVELSHAVVDPDKCVLCLTCIRTCPYKALQIDKEKGAAESLPEVCQKCGICAGECPAKAIELPIYEDSVILNYVNA